MLLQTWSDNKDYNTVEFVCIVHNSQQLYQKFYNMRTSDESVILQSCFLDVLPRYTKTKAVKVLGHSDE